MQVSTFKETVVSAVYRECREHGSTYEEESSNDSVDTHLNGRARNTTELE